MIQVEVTLTMKKIQIKLKYLVNNKFITCTEVYIHVCVCVCMYIYCHIYIYNTPADILLSILFDKIMLMQLFLHK